jgi:hypothetical protein
MDTLSTALAYRKQLNSRSKDAAKPVVYFKGIADFDEDLYPGHVVAHVRTVNHPAWGSDRVRTSSVINKFDDGSFETLNTIYKPYPNQD